MDKQTADNKLPIGPFLVDRIGSFPVDEPIKERVNEHAGRVGAVYPYLD